MLRSQWSGALSTTCPAGKPEAGKPKVRGSHSVGLHRALVPQGTVVLVHLVVPRPQPLHHQGLRLPALLRRLPAPPERRPPSLPRPRQLRRWRQRIGGGGRPEGLSAPTPCTPLQHGKQNRYLFPDPQASKLLALLHMLPLRQVRMFRCHHKGDSYDATSDHTDKWTRSNAYRPEDAGSCVPASLMLRGRSMMRQPRALPRSHTFAVLTCMALTSMSDE